MLDRPPATWLPTVLGVAAALLGIHAVSELLTVPAGSAQFLLLGILLDGTTAWLVAALHAAFLAWLAHACFQRRVAAFWGVLGYSAYWIASVWIWSTLHDPHDYMTRLITNSLFTVMVLALGRTVLAHRDQFHR